MVGSFVAIFFVIASLFFLPLYQGKDFIQSDNVQLSGTSRELSEYRELGRNLKWSNTEFSGMPLMVGGSTNPFIYVQKFLKSFLHTEIAILMLLMSGFYVLGLALNVTLVVRLLGALAFAFSTFNIISLEAGHDNKVYAMAFMAPILGGMIWVYNKEYLKGFLTVLIATSYQVYFGHIQISYYTLILIISYFLYDLLRKIAGYSFKEFLKPNLILLLAGVLAVGINISKLWALQEYAQYSNRGGSELTETDDSDVNTGLDKEYAFRWSNGKSEVLTILFPYFHGGATVETLGPDSETAQALRTRNVDRGTTGNLLSRVNTYWGEQPGTAGPLYFGAFIVILYILGFVVLDRKLMIWASAISLLAILLSMGKNFMSLSEFFFDYVPLYNRFRSVTMIMSIPQLIFPMVAMMTLSKMMDILSKKNERYKLFKVVGGVVGASLLLIIFKDAFFDFVSPSDSIYSQNGYPDWLIAAIQADRAKLFQSDILRSMGFVILGLLVLWLGSIKKINENLAFGLVALLVFIDLGLVNKRYVTSDDFSRPVSDLQVLKPSKASLSINQDKGYYRVFNTTVDAFNEGITSMHHNSIGGYNAIKIQRYQDLIQGYLSRGHRPVLDMLNTKYFIVPGQNEPVAQRNVGAMGNAWFIKRVNEVSGAQKEFDALRTINPREEAIFDTTYVHSLPKDKTFTGLGTITLDSYDPERLVYHSESDEDQIAVFSEVFYTPGWRARVNGQEFNILRANYILRSLHLPAGSNEIEFYYTPNSYRIGDKVSVMCSILATFFCIGFFRFEKRLHDL